MKKIKVVISLLFAFAGVACGAMEFLVEKDGSMGVAFIPPAWNEWKTSAMVMRDKPVPGDEKICGDDFFIREYGEKWNESFTIGTNSFMKLFGSKGKDLTEPAIRLCRGWGRLDGTGYYLVADVEQSVPETKWVFALWENGYKHPVDFSIKTANGKTNAVVRLGDIRGLQRYSGISFECLTTNASVKISNASIVPMQVPTVWEGTFVVDFDPWKAGISLGPRPSIVVKVNGKKVAEGMNLDGEQYLKKDISKYIVKGTNTISVTTPYTSGYCNPGELRCEAFAISEEGEVAMLSKGSSWTARIGERKPREPRWSKDPLHVIGNDHFFGAVSFGGVQPIHAGPLRITPADGRKYRIWNEGDEIKWNVDLPPKMKNVRVVKTVRNSLTGEIGEAKKGGAYRATWELKRGTNTLDKTSLEFVVAGPVAQDAYPAAQVDAVLDSRKKLVQEQNCADEVSDPARYAFDRVFKNTGNATLNHPRVSSEGGFKFRETGIMNGDWFGYKLDVKTPGAAHVLEVDYPDTREQTLYVRVVAGYPVPFVNNSPWGRPGIPVSSGAVRTGWMQPLSGKKQTMKIIFFPGSKNITVSFETGGGRAAVMGWRLYEVPDGLPAMKFPETTRLYGNHCERPIWCTWGSHINGKISPGWPKDYDGVYAASYASIVNRIRYMRFTGQNLAIDGVYMYSTGFPTMSGESGAPGDRFDYMYMAAMMYKQNDIRAFACFEYLASPAVGRGGGFDTGDREMRASKTPLTPSYCVTRYGSQLTGYAGMGLNYLEPRVWGSITNLLTEIYARYEPLGAFEGLFVINNGWWLPGIPRKTGLSLRDSSYDDYSVGMFERDTGIDLGIPYTPERFAKRYESLTTRYEKEWFGWRAKKIRQALEEMRAIVSKGKGKWKLYTCPLTGRKPINPYENVLSTPEELDSAQKDLLKDCGFDSALYGKGSGAQIDLIPTGSYKREHDLYSWGQIVNTGTMAIVKKNDAMYLTPHGLDERWTSTKNLKKWWWKSGVSTVFDMKPSHTAAYYDLVDVCAIYTPRILIHTWLDVNLPTAHSAEERRFATGFYSTPEGEYKPFENITGVQARRCGNVVQLINDTPYPVVGDVSVKPLFTLEDAYEGERKGKFVYRLGPYGITTFKVRMPSFSLKGAFKFEDEGVVREAREKAKRILDTPMLLSGLRPETAKGLNEAFEKNEHYELVALLRRYDVAMNTSDFFKYLALNPKISKAEELRVLVDSPEVRAPAKGEVMRIPALDGKYKSATRSRTVSFEVRTVSGEPARILLYDHPFRYDVTVTEKGVVPSFLYFGFNTDEKRRCYFYRSLPKDMPLPKGEWHKVTYHVDAEKKMTLVQVNGRIVFSLDMDVLYGKDLVPSNGAIGSSDLEVKSGVNSPGFEFRNFKILEGVSF